MQKKFDDFLAAGTENPTFSIAYDIGNSFSGETHLFISGDGTYQLWSTVTLGKQRLDYNGKLSLMELQSGFRELAETRFWKGVEESKQTISDDVKTKITVVDGNDSQSASVWISQLKYHPQFKSAQNKLLKWVSEFSDGKILESGQ